MYGLVLWYKFNQQQDFQFPQALKDKITQKLKFCHPLLILALLESRGKFHSPQKHFWSFTTKQCCSILLNKWRRWGLVFVAYENVLWTTKLHSIFHQHDSWVKKLNFHFEWIYPLSCKQAARLKTNKSGGVELERSELTTLLSPAWG